MLSCVALLVALGGSAFAAGVLPRGSVGTVQIQDGAVTSAKVKDASLARADCRSGQLPAGSRGPAGPAGAAGAAGPAGPSDALAAFHDAPILVPASYTAMATLAVPDPGRYAVWSKAIIGNTKVIAVRCRLVAGSDVDESLVNGGDFTFFTISNTVVHEFAEPGVVELQCRRDTGGDPPRAWNIKIVAVKVGSLSNRPS